MLNFYKIKNPYYALVYAKNEDEVLKKYEEDVCEKDEFTECEQVSLDDAFALMMLSGAAIEEIKVDLSGGKAIVLAADANLE